MLDAVLAGAADEQIVGVTVVTRAALAATPTDLLLADGLILGTPANMGYMAGGLKVFFDNCYYPCLRESIALPYGLYVHGNSDVTGAVRSVQLLARGLGWQPVTTPVEVTGAVDPAARGRLRELGALVAATVMP
ncbi:MAG: NAD(P)H-dependent oxidoreductase [Mycobacteriales bacterium]